MDQQGDFSVQFAERGVSGKRHGDQITHTADIHHDLVGAFIGKPAAKLSNHRLAVLPLSLRPSTRRWVCVYGREKGTTPCWRASPIAPVRAVFVRAWEANIHANGSHVDIILFASVTTHCDSVSTVHVNSHRAATAISRVF